MIRNINFAWHLDIANNLTFPLNIQPFDHPWHDLYFRSLQHEAKVKDFSLRDHNFLHISALSIIHLYLNCYNE